MSEANKAVVRRFVEEVQTKHNLAVAGELFDPNGVNHSPVPGLPPGLSMLEEFEIFFGLILTAFPDIRAEIHTQVAEGDKVVTTRASGPPTRATLWASLPRARPWSSTSSTSSASRMGRYRPLGRGRYDGPHAAAGRGPAFRGLGGRVRMGCFPRGGVAPLVPASHAAGIDATLVNPACIRIPAAVCERPPLLQTVMISRLR